MKALWMILSVLLFGGIAMAEVEWETSDLGETAFIPMESAPFPHESRVDGHEYGDTKFPADKHYSDNTVALFVPAGFEPTDSIDLIYYFHGWGNNVRQSLETFNLREQIVASGKNVILVFPEGPKDASDSTIGRLEEEGAFANLTEEAFSQLKKAGKVSEEASVGRIILSGHSGAYRAMSFAAQHGGIEDHLSEIYLLDASYAMLDNFADWLARGEDHRLCTIFTEHLAGDNVDLMLMLEERDVPSAMTRDETLSEEWLKENRAAFIYTKIRDHNTAVERLEIFLKTSGNANLIM